jgi:dihydrofolate reductase
MPTNAQICACEVTMIASMFVGTSIDGFIARLNGDLDFLPEGGGEPHGYTEFMAGVDTLVIGRKTFETVAAYQEWPYGGKRVVVLSSRAIDWAAAGCGFHEHMAGPPADIVAYKASTASIPNDAGAAPRRSHLWTSRWQSQLGRNGVPIKM